jgi:hypothetical protein
MIRPIISTSALISLIFFPWFFTVVLALGAAFFEPLVPLGIGLLADTLYYGPESYSIPLYTLLGAVVSGIAAFVRTRLRPGMMD